MQDEELTQHTIDRRQTLIAFDSMDLWIPNGSVKLHVHKNNEIAGCCLVLQLATFPAARSASTAHGLEVILHCVRLGKPGTMRELTTLIGELHRQSLDRDRPLWEAWVVHVSPTADSWC